MKISAITSFNKHYYNLIGIESVNSWLKFWPNNIKLTCYVEDFRLSKLDPRLVEITFDELPKEYVEFQQDPTLKPRVKTFAKKAYSIIHAFENSDADRIIWIDADVITTNLIPKIFLENICPDDTLLSYMRVWHPIDKNDLLSKEVSSAESGFFVVNTKHLEFINFKNRYREYYDKRIKDNLRRFYDGEVLDAVAQEFEDKCKIIDLCQDVEKRYNSPLKHLPIGKYLKHYKSKHSKEEFKENQHQ
jgi:hypothetical protein